jgi:hypothetical protein
MTFLALSTDRLDTWLCLASAALPAVALAGLALWHLVGFLEGKLGKPRRRVVRHSPEPAPLRSSTGLPDQPAPAGGGPSVGELLVAAEAKRLAARFQDDPGQLERACATLADCLAQMYLELAEGWLRRGEPRKGEAALQQLLRNWPETPWAQTARQRLQQLGAGQAGLEGDSSD